MRVAPKAAASVFKREIGQVVSEGDKLETTKTESEKVTNMVGTFLNEGCTGSLFKREIGLVVSEGDKLGGIKTESEKVTNMVGTFLNEDCHNN